MDFADLQMSCKVLTLRVGRLLVVDGTVSLAQLDYEPNDLFRIHQRKQAKFPNLGDSWGEWVALMKSI